MRFIVLDFIAFDFYFKKCGNGKDLSIFGCFKRDNSYRSIIIRHSSFVKVCFGEKGSELLFFDFS